MRRFDIDVLEILKARRLSRFVNLPTGMVLLVNFLTLSISTDDGGGELLALGFWPEERLQKVWHFLWKFLSIWPKYGKFSSSNTTWSRRITFVNGNDEGVVITSIVLFKMENYTKIFFFNRRPWASKRKTFNYSFYVHVRGEIVANLFEKMEGTRRIVWN